MSICKSFGGKKNQSRRSKASGRGVACMIFALCSRAISLSSWLHFGKKKWFSLQGTWLTEWLILCLWLDSVFRALWLADAKIVTFTLRDPCTRSLGTFLSLRLILLVLCRLYMSSRAFQLFALDGLDIIKWLFKVQVSLVHYSLLKNNTWSRQERTVS